MSRCAEAVALHPPGAMTVHRPVLAQSWAALHPPVLGACRCADCSHPPSPPVLLFPDRSQIVAGIHGDEAACPELLLRLLGYLASRYSDHGRCASLLDAVELHALPVMNPDGRAAGKRLNAAGYDLNRNFPLDQMPYGATGRCHIAYSDMGMCPEGGAASPCCSPSPSPAPPLPQHHRPVYPQPLPLAGGGQFWCSCSNSLRLVSLQPPQQRQGQSRHPTATLCVHGARQAAVKRSQKWQQ